MDWVKLLKDLLIGSSDTEVNLRAQAAITTKVTTKRNSDNKDQTVNIQIGTLNQLNVKTNEDGLLDEETLKQLQSVILPQFEEGRLKTLQADSNELLFGIKAFKQEPETKTVLEFFKGKITESDLRLVESGMYEAYLLRHDQIDKAKLVKSGIQNRYGNRGLNIVNLASRGYYATHIMPLYVALEEVGRADDFAMEYEQILRDIPFAIFVHRGTNEETLLAQVVEKAKKNIRYGVEEETITINGFGSTADVVEKLVPLLNEKFKRVAPVVNYLGTLKSIQVTVYYRDNK